jgi:hypothetical protein
MTIAIGTCRWLQAGSGSSPALAMAARALSAALEHGQGVVHPLNATMLRCRDCLGSVLIAMGGGQGRVLAF